MKTGITAVEVARGKALRSAPLRNALKEWFRQKGRCPDPEITNFGEWVERQISYLARTIKNRRLATADNLVKALAVNAIGDPLALRCAKEAAEKGGFKTDTNCYVEDGLVNSSVWVKNMAKERVEDMADKFREKGYEVDVWVDEEDETEITVNATIGFGKYLGLQKKGGR